MRRILVLALLALAALGLTAGASPAQADPCYTPHVAGFDSFEVCYNIPLPELSS